MESFNLNKNNANVKNQKILDNKKNKEFDIKNIDLDDIKLEKDQVIDIGSGRVAFKYDDNYIFKVPYNLVGLLGNPMEYSFSKNKSYVAKSYLIDNVLFQEKLTDLIIVPIKYYKENTVKSFLEKEVPNYDWSEIDKNKIYSRTQVGKNKEGKYVFFDYECVKSFDFNLEKIYKHLQEEDLDDFICHINKIGLKNISRSNLFCPVIDETEKIFDYVNDAINSKKESSDDNEKI